MSEGDRWVCDVTHIGEFELQGLNVTTGTLRLGMRPGGDISRLHLIAVRLPEAEGGVLERDAEGRPTVVRLRVKHLFAEPVASLPPPLGLDE